MFTKNINILKINNRWDCYLQRAYYEIKKHYENTSHIA